MLIKKSLYPKTQRVKQNEKHYVTEKIDGSNLGIFKLNGEIYIAQRKNIIKIDSDVNKHKAIFYGNLYNWTLEHVNFFKDNLYEGSVVFGEWLGMATRIKYDFKNSLLLFAKARIDEDFNITRLFYDLDNIKFVFKEQLIPDFLGLVPLAGVFDHSQTVKELNELYDLYCEASQRKVEGFVVQNNGKIQKYVRLKNGKLTEHMENAYAKH